MLIISVLVLLEDKTSLVHILSGSGPQAQTPPQGKTGMCAGGGGVDRPVCFWYSAGFYSPERILLDPSSLGRGSSERGHRHPFTKWSCLTSE